MIKPKDNRVGYKYKGITLEQFEKVMYDLFYGKRKNKSNDKTIKEEKRERQDVNAGVTE